MSSNDPRRQLRRGGDRGRMDRPPGWTDSLFAGRSRADKEADQDAMLLMLLVLGGVVVLLLVALHALFTMVGLQFGWWSAPVFAPLLLWLFACAACNRVLRPVELDGLSWRQRLAGAGMLARDVVGGVAVVGGAGCRGVEGGARRSWSSRAALPARRGSWRVACRDGAGRVHVARVGHGPRAAHPPARAEAHTAAW